MRASLIDRGLSRLYPTAAALLPVAVLFPAAALGFGRPFDLVATRTALGRARLDIFVMSLTPLSFFGSILSPARPKSRAPTTAAASASVIGWNMSSLSFFSAVLRTKAQTGLRKKKTRLR